MRDPSGREWLPALLRAAPNGPAALGEVVDDPGGLDIPLAVTGANGRLACFDYPVSPPRELLTWFVDHPEELVWPDGAELSLVSERLRRALIEDQPPGARTKAQDRAYELMRNASPRTLDWWRFEDTTTLECVLTSHRLVLVIDTDPLAAATDWYPQRTRLVRDLEAASRLARDRAFGTLVLGAQPLLEDELAQTVAAGTPHLSAAERDELIAAYLGSLTWAQASDAVD
jgi:hypothetical protein